jgi:cytochrome c-type biogenesis protein CcmH/NrfF
VGVLVWWLLPVVTTVLGIGWATWVRRAPRAAGDEETVEAYARFRRALARSSTAGPRPRDEATGNTASPLDV